MLPMGLGEATDQRCHQMPPGRPAPDHRQSPTACPAGRRPSRLVRTPACLRRAGSPSRARAPTCSAHTRPWPPRATAPVPTAHSSMPRVWQHLLRVPGLGDPAPHPTLGLSLVRREFLHRGGPGKLPSPGSFGAPSCMFWPLPSLPAAPGDGPPHGPQFTDGAETSPCSHAVCPPSPWLVQEPSPSGGGK